MLIHFASAIFNGKFVDSMPYDRMEQEFKRNGVNISKQDMSNWTVKISKKYLSPFCDRMKYHMLLYHVNQCDETPCQVINDGGSPGSKSYMCYVTTRIICGFTDPASYTGISR